MTTLEYKPEEYWCYKSKVLWPLCLLDTWTYFATSSNIKSKFKPFLTQTLAVYCNSFFILYGGMQKAGLLTPETRFEAITCLPLLFCLFLAFSQTKKSLYHTMTCLHPMFLVFWPSASSDNLHLFSSVMSVCILKPNYPPRTHRSFHPARSCLTAHNAHYTVRGCKHTCRHIKCGGSTGQLSCHPVKSKFTWCLDFWSIYLMGTSVIPVHHTSHLLYWSQVAFYLDKNDLI